MQQARALALDLYDGYDPAGAAARPLEGRARAELPKALRSLTADPKARVELQQLVDHGQRMASRLKTGALRAAYSEAIDAWQSGAGEAALQRRLDVAMREKNRYMANRIAQTELARAHQAQVAQELMADPEVEVVQVMINPTHPKRDICDVHARADLFGLGPGCYPKARAPLPIYHPHCHCKLRARRSLSGEPWRQVPNGEAAYLRSLGNLSQAGEVMGSRGRAEAVLNGTPVDQVINAARDPLYRLRRLGDGVGHPLVKAVENALVKAVENAPMPHPDALPNHDAAVIPESKISGYALNQDHEVGRHKARVFAAALGITRGNAAILEDAIRVGIRDSQAVKKHADKHGQRYEVDVPVTGPTGSAIVRTGWIVREDGGAPQLTSAYVKETP